MWYPVLLSVLLAVVHSGDVCPDGYHVVNGVCADIDECLNRPCKVNQNCINSEGSYECVKREDDSAVTYSERYAEILEHDTSPGDSHNRNGIIWTDSDTSGLHWWSMSVTPLTLHKVAVKLVKIIGATKLQIIIFHGEEKVGECEDFPLGSANEVTLKCDQVLCDKVKLVITSTGGGEMDIKDIKVRGSHTTKHKVVKHYYCPINYPNPYYHGHYCCKAGYEKVFGPQKDGCDGGVINEDSLCCKGAYRAACKAKSEKGCAVAAEKCRDDTCQGVNQVCSLPKGKVSCDCAAGSTLNAATGVCEAETCNTNPGLCVKKEECLNQAGVYSCVAKCIPGYKRNSDGVCEDINECQDVNVCPGDNQVCVNTAGGHSCPCAEGFDGFVTREGYVCKAPCGDGYSLDNNGDCEDVNECLSIPCKGNEDCINVDGGFECKERSNLVAKAPPAPTDFVCASSCWTRECDFCSSKTTCGLKYDLENNALTIRSKGLKAKSYLKVALYSETDKHLGTLSFNSRGVFLWGCIACRQLKARPKITSEPQIWVLEKVGNSIRITCDGTLIFEQELSRGCAKFYGVAITKVAFQSKRTSSVFAEVAVVDGMEADEGFSEDGCRT